MERTEITENYRRWSKSESDIICQGVEFLTDGRADMQQTCHHTVEEVEYRTNHDKKQSHREIALEGKPCRYAAGDEVAAGDSIGDMLLDTHRLG